MRPVVVLLASLAIGAPPALSQDMLDPQPLAGAFNEFRLGLHAYNVHHAALPFLVNEWQLRDVESISFDMLFASPEVEVFRWIGSPRPEIGATINLGGRESLVHAGLTWQLPIFETPLYLEGTFGAAVHNGALSGAAAPQKNFGCRVNFYERFGVGIHATDAVTATLTYEHTSNDGLCNDNAGLSNFGLRIGWKF